MGTSERDPVQPGCMVREASEDGAVIWRVLSRQGDVAWLCLVVEDEEGSEHHVLPCRLRRASDGLWQPDEGGEEYERPLRLVPADDGNTDRILMYDEVLSTSHRLSVNNADLLSERRLMLRERDEHLAFLSAAVLALQSAPQPEWNEGTSGDDEPIWVCSGCDARLPRDEDDEDYPADCECAAKRYRLVRDLYREISQSKVRTERRGWHSDRPTVKGTEPEAALARLSAATARVRAALGAEAEEWTEGPPSEDGVYCCDMYQGEAVQWAADALWRTGDDRMYDWPTVAGRPARYRRLEIQAPPTRTDAAPRR